MKILITGGVGHIGTNMTLEAIVRGHEVVVMDNLHRQEVIENLKYLEKINHNSSLFQFVWGDIRNQTDFDRLPKVDAVIHLAANPGVPWSIQWPVYDFETNARGTLNTLEFARTQGKLKGYDIKPIPFIYASTNKTFSDIINEIPSTVIPEEPNRYVWHDTEALLDKSKDLWTNLIGGLEVDKRYGTIEGINENFPVSGFGKYGHSMYGISKLVGDLYCQEYHIQYGIPMVINKMSCIYGLFQKGVADQGWVSHFVLKLLKGDGKLEFYGNGKQVRDVLDARDLARLYLDQLENIDKCNGEIFTVGGGPENTVSLIEAVEEIERQTGKKATITYKDKRPADQDIYISSIKHVREVLGWEPKIKFEQTIADMIKEYEV